MDTRRRVLAVLKEIGDLMQLANRDSEDNGDYTEVRRLWDIVSALRGPDNEHFALKDATTARVRSAIGVPENSYITTDTGPLLSPEEFHADERIYSYGNYHFNSHYERAYRALKELGLCTTADSPENKTS